MKNVGIIGAGLAGLYAACVLSKKKGYNITVVEKNEMAGGRSRYFKAEGFTFDMGPSWYWMPDVIDRLFEELGENREDYFKLKRLNPSYQVFWKDSEPTKIPADKEELFQLFDDLEEGGGDKLRKFLHDAEVKYKVAVANFLENPGDKWSELINLETLKYAFQLDLLKSVAKDVGKRFKSSKAQAILNFPVLFLGEMPNKIPSLYTLMNYADLELGTWYPEEGGMHALADALKQIAEKNGVKFIFDSEIHDLQLENDKVISLQNSVNSFDVDEVIGAADYHFIEQELIPEKYRRYNEKYWDKRKLAPSSLLFYIGLNKEVPGLLHHNLFFDEDLFEHGKEIYDHPQWPKKPLFYVSAPSKTDDKVAPEGCENLFFLMPLAPDLKDNEELRDQYFDIICNRINQHLNFNIKDHIVYKRSYCVNDFKADYNSYKGNAYGLANTLMQTANLKPKIKSKLSNLTYCGQLTVPGPGMPAVMISGKIAAKIINEKYEGIV